MKKIVKCLFCFLGAFVFAFGLAVLPFLNTYSSYASTIDSTYDNFYSPVGNKWEDFTWNTFTPGSFHLNGSGENVYSVNGTIYHTYNSETHRFYDDYTAWSWIPYTWTLETIDSSYPIMHGKYVVSVGTDSYYMGRSSSGVYYTYKYDVSSDSWVTVNWTSSTGYTNFLGEYVWTDGVNYYYSYSSYQFILDFDTMTATAFSWTGGYNSLNGKNIWTDGVNYYISTGTNQYQLDIENYNVIPILWNGYSSFSGQDVWTDGVNYYVPYELSSLLLKLDVATRTWDYYFFYDNSSAPANLKGLYIWYYKDYIIYHGPQYDCYRSLLGVYSKSYEEGYNVGYNVGYSAGVADASSSSSSYQDGYNAGYNAGISTNSGYTEGYNTGYSVGYRVGYNEGSSEGYDSGYTEGNREGYNTGYAEGVEDSNQYTFLGLVGAVIDAPIQAFTNLFNFELFGTNIKNLLLALFTASVIVVVVKFSLGGK